MLKKILLGLILITVALAGLIMLQPSTYSVSRTSEPMKATPTEVFAYVNDFHQWNKWAPWFNLDPKMQQTYTGAASGKGAIYDWKSADKSVGQGRMEITNSVAPSQVDIQLDFIEPFASNNMTMIKIDETEPGGSRVTWTMSGPADFTTKIMTFFGTMDSMIGKDFDKGLAKLKEVAENPAPAATPAQ